MLEQPTHIFDDRATTYATGTDFWNILTDEMHRLHLLSFLLTADLEKAEQCLSAGWENARRKSVFSWRGHKHGPDARSSSMRSG